MRTFGRWVFVASVSSLTFACKTTGNASQIAAVDDLSSTDQVLRGNSGESPVSNFGQAGPKLFRGGQLGSNEERFKFLRDAGVKNIINLQTFHKVDDAELCAKYNMTCIRHEINPLANDWIPKTFDWPAFKQAFADGKASLEKGDGVYVHCYIGKDRTGALITALSIYPTVCAGKPYDAEALEKQISASYEKYGSSLPMHGLRDESISWAKNPPAWLCQ